MKRLLPVCLASLATLTLTLRADDETRRYQQALRDQGFYYGQVDGGSAEETTHAVRRFQIRNALPVTGKLDAATKKAIEAASEGIPPSKAPATPSAPAPARDPDVTIQPPEATPAPKVAKPIRPTPPPRGRYDNDPAAGAPSAPTPPARGRYENDPAPGLRRPAPEAPVFEGEAAPRARTPIFIGGPYESAPPFVQGTILSRAQAALAREGFYEGEADGRAGGRTQQAVRDFQASTGLRMSGRLDGPTLNALGIEAPVYEGRAPAPRRPARPPVRRGEAPYLGNGVYEGRIVPEGR